MPVHNLKSLRDTYADEGRGPERWLGHSNEAYETNEAHPIAPQRYVDCVLNMAYTGTPMTLARGAMEQQQQRAQNAQSMAYSVQKPKTSIKGKDGYENVLGSVGVDSLGSLPQDARREEYVSPHEPGGSSWFKESVAWANAIPTIEDFAINEEYAWSANAPIYMGSCGSNSPAARPRDLSGFTRPVMASADRRVEPLSVPQGQPERSMSDEYGPEYLRFLAQVENTLAGKSRPSSTAPSNQDMRHVYHMNLGGTSVRLVFAADHGRQPEGGFEAE